MSLQGYIENLPKKKRIVLAIKFAKLGIPIWERYAKDNDLTYRDTVVGLTHSVEVSLLQRSISSVEKYLGSNEMKRFFNGKRNIIKLRREFDEPIVALQDFDWTLPDEIQLVFYAVYNLLDAFLLNNKSSAYTSINQSIEVLEKSQILSVDDIRKILPSND